MVEGEGGVRARQLEQLLVVERRSAAVSGVEEAEGVCRGARERAPEHGADGRDARAVGDEDGFALRCAVEGEGAPRAREAERRADLEVEEVVRPRSARDPVDHQLQAVGLLGTGGDRVGADEPLLADGQQAGDELAGPEGERSGETEEERAGLRAVVHDPLEPGRELRSRHGRRSD